MALNWKKSWLAVIMTGFLLWGCGNPGSRNPKPVVLVSILPQKTFVEKIAGDLVTVSVLIPPGANPTTHTLLPAQMEEIAAAATWLRMGYVGFELSWADKITAANPDMKVVDLSERLPLIAGNQGDGHSAPTGVDPHTWLSPSLVKIMAERIRNELSEMFPANSGEIEKRYHLFLATVDSTDNAVRDLLSGKEGKTFISFHPSLSYFAREYHLVQLSLEQGGKEPTPAHMAFLTGKARESGIKSIFIQSDFDQELARVFAEEINGTIVKVNPLSPEWDANLMEIARLLSESL